jgi:biofilm PGA synthesis protein PgaA
MALARLISYARMTAVMPLVFALTAVNVAPAAAPKIDGSNDVRTMQYEAVKLARAGEFDDALQIIASLRTKTPGDQSLLYDETTILAWAGRDTEVMVNAAQLDSELAPEYLLTAVAKSARNVRRFDEAALWYQAALARRPDNLDARLGLAMAQGDGGLHQQARVTLDMLMPNQRDRPDVRLTSAYLYERRGQYLQAIADYDLVLAREPDHQEALRGKTLALRSLLLPQAALELARQHPGIVTTDELEQLEADELAIALRRAVEATYAEPTSAAGIDAVLERLETRLADAPPASTLARRLRYDRIVALVERRRMDDAISDYESLVEQDPRIPAYVHAATGRAYIYARRPEDALAALERAAHMAPGDPQIEIELFYAHSELQHYEQAIEIADALVARYSATGGQDSPARMQAEIMAAVARAYADRLAESQRRLETLVASAPNNSDARQELANVYRWRGWTDRAFSEYSQVLTIEPDQLSARVGHAQTRMDRQEYDAVETELFDLKHYYADHGSVLDLDRRWHLHNQSEYRAEANWGESSGDTFGSDSYDINTWWYTAPLQRNYRLFAHTFDSWAEFNEGNVSRRRAGIGLEYRKSAWQASAEANFDRTDTNDPGLVARIQRRLSDEWSVEGLLELNSYETPLRAHRDEIDSNLVGFNAGYRRHESLSGFTGARYQDFSDGNRRMALFADGRWRQFNGQRYKLDATASLYTSTNSLDGASYFNPERDLELMLGLDHQWRMFRRYDQILVHRLSTRAGTYDQANYGSGLIWDLNYEINWDVTDALALRLGWNRARRMYDGAAEYQTYWLAALDGRF